MDHIPETVWIAACAHRLHLHWRTVDPVELETVAGELAGDARLRAMLPTEAATAWLQPVESCDVQSIHPPGHGRARALLGPSQGAPT